MFNDQHKTPTGNDETRLLGFHAMLHLLGPRVSKVPFQNQTRCAEFHVRRCQFWGSHPVGEGHVPMRAAQLSVLSRNQNALPTKCTREPPLLRFVFSSDVGFLNLGEAKSGGENYESHKIVYLDPQVRVMSGNKKLYMLVRKLLEAACSKILATKPQPLSSLGIAWGTTGSEQRIQMVGYL